MKTIALLSTSLAATLVALLPGTPAQALDDRTWVSFTGSGTACTRVTPCNNFLDAHNATAPGGEINCLDSGPFTFSPVFFTKSITIDCAGAGAASAIFFRVDGAGIVVRIRNLTFNGALSGGSPTIDFVNGAALFVENCAISGLRSGPGILFRPSGSAKLVVSNSTITDNGTGILIDPGASGFALVTVQNVTLQGNTGAGLVATGNGGGGVHVSVRDSLSTLNGNHGFAAVTNVSGVVMKLERVEASFNNSFGVFGNGPTAIAIGNSNIIGNGTGIAQFNGSQIFSHGNNSFFDNGTDGTPNGIIALK